jgi:hypothetical protein
MGRRPSIPQNRGQFLHPWSGSENCDVMCKAMIRPSKYTVEYTSISW